MPSGGKRPGAGRPVESKKAGTLVRKAFRVDATAYDTAVATARVRGDSLGAVLRAAMARYNRPRTGEPGAPTGVTRGRACKDYTHLSKYGDPTRGKRPPRLPEKPTTARNGRKQAKQGHGKGKA